MRTREELLKELGGMQAGYSRPARLFSDEERGLLDQMVKEGLVERGADMWMQTGYWLKGR